MKYFSIFFMLMLWQNTITESPGFYLGIPETSIPFAVSHQATDGYTYRHSEVFHRFLG